MHSTEFNIGDYKNVPNLSHHSLHSLQRILILDSGEDFLWVTIVPFGRQSHTHWFLNISFHTKLICYSGSDAVDCTEEYSQHGQWLKLPFIDEIGLGKMLFQKLQFCLCIKSKISSLHIIFVFGAYSTQWRYIARFHITVLVHFGSVWFWLVTVFLIVWPRSLSLCPFQKKLEI